MTTEVSLNVTPCAESDNGYASIVYTLGKTCTYHTKTSFGDKAKAETMFHDPMKGCTLPWHKQYQTVRKLRKQKYLLRREVRTVRPRSARGNLMLPVRRTSSPKRVKGNAQMAHQRRKRTHTVCTAGADPLKNKRGETGPIHTHGTGCLMVCKTSEAVGTSHDSKA